MIDTGRYVGRSFRIDLSTVDATEILTADPTRVMVVFSADGGLITPLNVDVYPDGDVPVKFVASGSAPLILTWKDHGPIVQSRMTGLVTIAPQVYYCYILQWR